MNKQLLTLASFMLGGAGVILVAHLSANPLAFTHPIGALPFEAPPSAETSIAIENSPILLAEVIIAAVPSAAPQSRAQKAQLDPCSGWDDVGALYIEPGGATGVHRVRRLCH